jgi:hypothetical protein
MSLTPLVLFTALLVGGASASHAEVNRWTTHGPEEGWVRSVTVDPANPGRLYASAEGGTFVSNNGGDRWSRTDPSLDLTSTTALIVDPRDSNILFAISTFGDIFSENAGAGWRELPVPAFSFLASLAIDPVAPERLVRCRLSIRIHERGRRRELDLGRAINRGIINVGVVA